MRVWQRIKNEKNSLSRYGDGGAIGPGLKLVCVVRPYVVAGLVVDGDGCAAAAPIISGYREGVAGQRGA